MPENYYLLLELDPEEDDWGRIQERITECKHKWNQDKTGGTQAAQDEAGKKLGLVSEIENTLSDEGSRKRIAAEAKKLLADRREEQRKKLAELISYLCKGKVDATLVRKLVRRSGADESEVKNQLKARGITVAAAGEPGCKLARPTLDSTIADEIQRSLESVQKTDLYDFLGEGRSSSSKVLYEKADELYKELTRRGTSDVATKSRRIAGHCLNVFEDDTQRELYDNAFADQAMHGFDGILDVAGSQDKCLSADKVERVVGTARGRGIDRDVAREYIERYAHGKNWFFESADTSAAPPPRVCGSCNAVGNGGDQRCRACGEELVKQCPNCNAPTPTEDRCCSRCGFATGDAQHVENCIEEGRRHAAEGDFSSAEACFDRALKAWRDWAPALRAKSDLAETRKQHEAALVAVESLVQDRKLEAARHALDRLRRQYGNRGTDPLHERVNAGLDAARAACREAEKHRDAGRDDDAFDKYQHAVDACADFPLALRGLRESPPAPPSALSVQMVGGTARLRWNGKRGRRSTTYRVVRKESGAPRGPGDGTAVCVDLTGSSCDDAGVPPGMPWHYGVYAVRGGVTSRSAATSGPHIHAADPGRVRAEAINGQVMLRWTRPPGCLDVEVWRNSGTPPLRPGEGTPVTVAGDSATDHGLTNGARYGYLVVACFRGPGRNVRRSPGVAVEATPVAPPKPVDDLRVSKAGRAVILKWTPPPRGTVQLRLAETDPGVSAGEVVASSDAHRFGVQVPITDNGGETRTTPARQGYVFFVPLTFIEATGVVGKPVSVSTLEDVKNIKTLRRDNTIQFTWAWPAGAEVVRVVWSYDHYPSDANDGAQSSVKREEYDANGCWELRQARRDWHYFKVFVKDRNTDNFSAGVEVIEATGLEKRVTYEVVTERQWFTRRITGVWLDLQTKENVGSLTRVNAVLKESAPPMHPRDGRTIASPERLEFRNGRARLKLPESCTSGFVKLFFENGQTMGGVRLLPPGADRLRV